MPGDVRPLMLLLVHCRVDRQSICDLSTLHRSHASLPLSFTDGTTGTFNRAVSGTANDVTGAWVQLRRVQTSSLDTNYCSS